MNADGPQPGDLSADGRLRSNGQLQAPVAPGRRMPTAWTVPMQRLAATGMAVPVLYGLTLKLLFTDLTTYERMVQAASPGLRDSQLRAAAVHASAVGWWTLGAGSVFYLVMFVGSLRGWRWVFWVLLAIGLPASAFVLVTDALALSGVTNQFVPQWVIAVHLVLTLAGLGLWVWFIVAVVRFGPWAMRRTAPYPREPAGSRRLRR